VQEKGGRTRVFGVGGILETSPVKVLTLQNGTDRESPQQIFRWKLVSDEDAHGNRAIYVWRPLGVRGLSYLTDIYDTPRIDQQFLTSSSYAHHTHLRWDSSGFRITNYAHIDRASMDLRLARVAIASTTWAGDGEREVIRAYNLSYLDARSSRPYDPATQSPLWGHSFLKSVQMEGRCGKRELGGEISPVTGCPQLPATTFGYQSGVLATGQVTALSRVTGAPKDAEANSNLLSDTRTATVMDINHDGLPDVVQSWGADAFIDLVNHKELRGQSALLNRGNDGVSARFEHQCIDAGTAFGGIALHNLVQRSAFLSPFQGASVLGAWGDSLLLWNKVDYAPVALRATAADAAFCPAVTADPPDPNHPAWFWSPNSQIGWLRSADSPGGNQPNKRWFADVDGDGLPDEFEGVGGAAPQDLELSVVNFTRRVTGSDSVTGGAALIPFVPNLALPAQSLAPSSTARGDTRFFFADVNGDGLTDLVLTNPGDNGGIPRVRFGDGRGIFACIDAKQPEPCGTGGPVDTGAMLIDVPDAQKPWPLVPDTYFHDVTGDGLADIVQLELGDGTGRIKLWINQDGRTFRCAAPDNGCVIGRIFDDLHGTFMIQPAHVTFADMNGNGIDDIVVVSGAGVMYFQVVQNTFVGAFAQARAPRPGLLITLDNGRGATREIEYQTVQELDLAASHSAPWQFHSPQVVPVVTGVAVRNTETVVERIPVKGPFGINRWTSYSYRDPAYDLWERRFLGFRKVTKQQGGEISKIESTYVFGPCQREILDCPGSSDDDGFKAMTGRLVRSERSFPAGNGIGELSVTRYDYTNGSLFTTTRGHVWFAYPSSRTTFLFDDKAPSTPGPSFQVPGSPDLVDGTPEQKGSPRILETMMLDRHGEVTESIQHGRVSETLENIDEPLKTTVSPLDCTASWKCRPDVQTTEVPGSFNRQTKYTYNAAEDLSDVESLLQGTGQLKRKPASPGATVAETPESASTDGWRKLLHLDYDLVGNITTVHGPGTPEACIQLSYDELFGQFPQTTFLRTMGCAESAQLTILREFDRGTGQMTRKVAPNGGVMSTEFDGFGRPHLFNVPKTEGMAGITALAQRITYNDAGPLYSQVTEQFTDASAPMVTVDYANALDEPIFTFEKADPAAGDVASWVLSGSLQRDQSGRISRLQRASFFDGHAMDAEKIRQPFQLPVSGVFDISYDEFGRKAMVSENQNPVSRYRYKPLQVEIRDAEQLKIGGGHAGALSRTEMDGHGRVIRSSQVMQGDTVRTERTYLASGEPIRIVQSHDAGGEQVVRTMEYDSFGRMVRNVEPNTSTSTGGLLTYMWDDSNRLVATSDARGCGENRFYDGVGRLLAEDYSPCRPGQPAYTKPDLTTGDGTEAFFRYDTYEPGQLSSTSGFTDAAENAAGMMTASANRGAYTRFNYDPRGNLRLLSRRMAKPGEATSSLGTRFSSHEFSVRSDYDLADRLVRQTSGADAAGLLASGASEEGYQYSARGLVSEINSAYGILSAYTRYDAEGLLQERIFGDAAHTKQTIQYDEKKRVSTKKLERQSTPVWVTASPTYILPKADTTQLQLENLDFTYDDVGNPTRIADTATAEPWPDGAKPNIRTAKFDDLYRLKNIRYDYAGSSAQVSPFASESTSGDTAPIPQRTSINRVGEQSFLYDWIGNLSSTGDDQNALFDRSLGKINYGEAQGKPNQIDSAANGAVRAKYDDTGNLVDLVVERMGTCPVGLKSQCAQRYSFDWDEVGQLMRGRRWDFVGPTLPPDTPVYPNVPSVAPSWDINYAYSNGMRVLQSTKSAAGDERHSVDVFESLRLAGTTYDAGAGDYMHSAATETAYLGGMARIINASDLPSPDGSALHVLLDIFDQLGSTSQVIDAKSGELIERISYQAYGATESDYRPERWKSFSENEKYGGKDDDEELGLTYFGARYYHARLGQWISPDPLTIHAASGDLNPYAYVAGRVMTDFDEFGLEGESSPDDGADKGCMGAEKCGGLAEWQKELPETQPTTQADGGTTVPIPEDPVPEDPVPVEKPAQPSSPTEPFDPGKGLNWLDRWIVSDNGAFHDAVTSDRNLAVVQRGFFAVAIVAGTIATGGIALGAAGLTLEGVGATALVGAGRAAQLFTELSLAEQGIVGVGGVAGAVGIAEEGAGPLLNASFGTRYAGRVGPGQYAGRSVPAAGPGYATRTVRRILSAIMKEDGCHICGSKVGKTIADHQPPNALNPSGGPQRFYPQCDFCSPRQGNEVKAIKR